MADMRHRDGKLKTMHTIIGDYGRVLRQIAELDEVESILTGTIAPSKAYKESFTFQYFTDNGIKLLAKTTTAVQEIFIVTAVPDLLLDELRKMGYLESERDDVKHGNSHAKKRGRGARAAGRGPGHEREAPVTSGGPSSHSASRSSRAGETKDQAPTKAGQEADPITVGQRLDPDKLAALLKVKAEATPKPRVEAVVDPRKTPSGQRNKGGSQRSTSTSASRSAAIAATEEEDFASLFAPKEDEESFADLLNKSKLDPKFFK